MNCNILALDDFRSMIFGTALQIFGQFTRSIHRYLLHIGYGYFRCPNFGLYSKVFISQGRKAILRWNLDPSLNPFLANICNQYLLKSGVFRSYKIRKMTRNRLIQKIWLLKNVPTVLLSLNFIPDICWISGPLEAGL